MTRASHIFSTAVVSAPVTWSAVTPAHASMTGDQRFGVRRGSYGDALATRCALH
jgi:hypothetical protein